MVNNYILPAIVHKPRFSESLKIKLPNLPWNDKCILYAYLLHEAMAYLVTTCDLLKEVIRKHHFHVIVAELVKLVTSYGMWPKTRVSSHYKNIF